MPGGAPSLCGRLSWKRPARGSGGCPGAFSSGSAACFPTGEAAWVTASCAVLYLCCCCCCRHPAEARISSAAWSPSHSPNDPAATSWPRPESGRTTALSTAMKRWRARCCASCPSTGYGQRKLTGGLPASLRGKSRPPNGVPPEKPSSPPRLPGSPTLIPYPCDPGSLFTSCVPCRMQRLCGPGTPRNWLLVTSW